MTSSFRKNILSALLTALPLVAMGQAAPDILKMSQTDLRGTARFMSMGGAFGALGGDLTVLDQNPGGIGVYRSSDVGISVDFDAQSVKDGNNMSLNQFKVTCNTFGYVGAFKLDSDVMPNLNFGVSYSRPVSFNRHYYGSISNQRSSLTDYIATYTNVDGYKADDLTNFNPGKWDPYIDSNAPWMSILAYNSALINPNTDGSFSGLSGMNSTISSEYEVHETGGVDQFNINFGGNLANVVYWGMGFGITNLDYKSTTYYGENVNNGRIAHFKEIDDELVEQGGTIDGNASYGLTNDLHTFGSGYNFKLGVIVKPINELRLGIAFHTPTYYSLKDESITYSSCAYNPMQSDAASFEFLDKTNQGYLDEWWYKIRTPWKYIASAAVVIGKSGLISADYERREFGGIEYVGDNAMYDRQMKDQIKDYYKGVDIIRIGGEYRVSPHVSIRAGYSYESSPVNDKAMKGHTEIFTVSTTPAYILEKSTQYITCGLGYRYKNFYADLAYVHKQKDAEYHVFSPYLSYPANAYVESPTSKLTFRNNRVVVSLGVRF